MENEDLIIIDVETGVPTVELNVDDLVHNGKSAYQIAVDNGFTGTEQEWLKSLQGAPGNDYVLTPADKTEIAGEAAAKVDVSSRVSEHNTSVLSHSDMRADIESLKNISVQTVIDNEEHVIGYLRSGGKQYELYEKSIIYPDVAINNECELILSDQPFGDHLYLAVTSLSATVNNTFVPDTLKCKSVRITETGDTVAVVACDSAVSGAIVTLTVRYVKGLLSYTTYNITVSDVANPESLSLSMTPCKYNKSFALSYTGDVAYCGIYQRALKYILNQRVNKNDIWHDGMSETNYMDPTRMLTYTDGCGHPIPFTLSAGWKKSATGLSHTDGNTYLGSMWWSEAQKFLDYDCSLLNHGGGDESNGYQSITLNQSSIVEKLGVDPISIIVPAQSSGFPEAAEILDYIYFMESSTFTDRRNLVLSDLSGNVMNMRCGRELLDGDSLQSIKDLITPHTTGSVWTNLFSHNINFADNTNNSNAEYILGWLDWVYDTYGTGGNDTVWFASTPEIYEYIVAYNNFHVTKTVTGNTVVFGVKTGTLPHFRYPSWSFLLNQTANTISVDNGLYVTNNGTLINVSDERRHIEIAERYTKLYETTLTKLSQTDAMNMVNRLPAQLRQPYLDRLGDVALVLTAIRINNNSSTTLSRECTVQLSLRGIPTHYKITEGDIETAPWISYSGNTVNYTLSQGVGVKTLKMQIKNSSETSAVVTSSIELIEPTTATYTVTASSNDTQKGTVNPATQVVEEGGTATITATANSGCVISSWTGVTSATGLNSASSVATIHNVTSHKSVTCNFAAEPETPSSATKIILSLGAETPGVSKKELLSNGEYITFNAYTTYGGPTPLSVYDTTGAVVAKQHIDTLPAGYSTLGDTKEQNPDVFDGAPYESKYLVKYRGDYGGTPYPDHKGLLRLTELEAGTYKIRLYANRKGSMTEAQITGLVYVANGTQATLPVGYTPINNVSTWIEIDNVVVGSDRVLDIVAGNTQTWIRSGFNLVEIIKMS